MTWVDISNACKCNNFLTNYFIVKTVKTIQTVSPSYACTAYIMYSMINAVHAESNRGTSLSFFPHFMSQLSWIFFFIFFFLQKILYTTRHNEKVKKGFGRLFEILHRQVCFLPKSCLTEFTVCLQLSHGNILRMISGNRKHLQCTWDFSVIHR